MKSKNILIGSFVALALLPSCNVSKDNFDPKAFYEVSPEALYNTAQQKFSTQIVRESVNFNNFRLFVQYLAQTTYVNESYYDIISRAVPRNVFFALYTGVLEPLKQVTADIDSQLSAANLSEAQRKALMNQRAISEIQTVWAFSNLVETFGNIPYSQALDGDNLTPEYDDAQTVYTDLLKRLKTAIDALDPSARGFGIDNIYGGDVSKWKKLAASLYLRMGMVLADVDAAQSKTIVEEAVRYGVLSSNDDNAQQTYLTTQPNRNPLYDGITAEGRIDYVIANTLVQAMDALQDPRRPFYYTEKGRTAGAGYAGGVVGTQNTAANFSAIADAIVTVPDRKGLLFDYSEVKFLLAEAAARGFAVGGSAESHYREAIEASILYWGGTAKAVSDYLGKEEVDYLNAKSGADYKEKIGKQLWIAMYDRSDAAWLHWRRLDFPKLVAPSEAQSRFGLTEPPYRLTYPVIEQTINRSNYEEASKAIGEDRLNTKLFFDKY